MNAFNLAHALFTQSGCTVVDIYGVQHYFRRVTQLDTDHQQAGRVLVCGYVTGEFNDQYIATEVKID